MGGEADREGRGDAEAIPWLWSRIEPGNAAMDSTAIAAFAKADATTGRLVDSAASSSAQRSSAYRRSARVERRSGFTAVASWARRHERPGRTGPGVSHLIDRLGQLTSPWASIIIGLLAALEASAFVGFPAS
jgi:hypothetical protein